MNPTSTAFVFTIPRDRLPADTVHRRQVLTDYFPDFLASDQETERGYEVRLQWPDYEAFFVDPLITQHIGWWRAKARLGELRKEVCWSGTGQLALDDAWTLFGWSRWLSQKYSALAPPSEVVVIHVDDHQDMMCPLIVRSEQGWTDLLTGDKFSIFEPPKVRKAILSGSIGIGSFFTVLLHELPWVHIRHLKQSKGAAEDGREWIILKGSEMDTILQPGQQRPRINRELANSRPIRSPHKVPCGSYRCSRDYSRCLADLPMCPVLLHIDMDYFNNRYDRDSDWQDRPNKHDPSQEHILQEIDALFDALAEYGIWQRVENVTVALSPGFFPSEFWQVSTEKVEERLLKLGLSLGRGQAEE